MVSELVRQDVIAFFANNFEKALTNVKLTSYIT